MMFDPSWAHREVTRPFAVKTRIGEFQGIGSSKKSIIF